MSHRGRLANFVIDADDLDDAVVRTLWVSPELARDESLAIDEGGCDKPANSVEDEQRGAGDDRGRR